MRFECCVVYVNRWEVTIAIRVGWRVVGCRVLVMSHIVSVTVWARCRVCLFFAWRVVWHLIVIHVFQYVSYFRDHSHWECFTATESLDIEVIIALRERKNVCVTYRELWAGCVTTPRKCLHTTGDRSLGQTLWGDLCSYGVASSLKHRWVVSE